MEQFIVMSQEGHIRTLQRLQPASTLLCVYPGSCGTPRLTFCPIPLLLCNKRHQIEYIAPISGPLKRNISLDVLLLEEKWPHCAAYWCSIFIRRLMYICIYRTSFIKGVQNIFFWNVNEHMGVNLSESALLNVGQSLQCRPDTAK